MEAKRVISLVLTIALVLGIWVAPVNVAADQDAIISMTIGSAKAYVNLVPKTLDQPPVIINGRTMVPFRFIGEALDAFVDYDPTNKTVSYVLEGNNIILKIGSTTATVNGVNKTLEAAPVILKTGRTVVPVRFISEAIGAVVGWNATTRMVTITFKKEAVVIGGILHDYNGGDLDGFDPQSNTNLLLFNACRQIYSNLVTVGYKDFTIMPDAAKSWDTSTDGKTITFHLRNDIYFSDKTKLTANDVKFTFERCFDPNGPAYTSGVLDYYLTPVKIVGGQAKADGKASTVSGIKVLDDYTISFTLEQPFAPFIQILAIPAFGILSEKAVTKMGDTYFAHPVGSGPFYVKEWQRGSHILYAANLKYFKGRPALDGVHIDIVEDENTQVLKFKKGELDVLYPPLAQYDDLVKTYATNVYKTADMSYYRIDFNIKRKGPLQDIRVRQAIGYAINRDQILAKILKGQGYLAKGIFPPGLPAYNSTLPGFSYDLTKAKQLMKDAGYANGFSLEMVMRSGRMEDEHLAFQEALKQIGITVKLTKVDSATYWQLLGAGETDIAYRNWYADFADPDNFMAPLFHTGTDSSMGWAKPEYDAIIDKAAKLTRMSERIPLYQDLEKKLIYQDAIQFPLWNTITTVILNPKVRNYYLHPSGVVAYYPVYLAH